MQTIEPSVLTQLIKAKLEADSAFETFKKRVGISKQMLVSQSQNFDKNYLNDFEKKYKKLSVAITRLQ